MPPEPTPPDSLMAALREHTRDLHDRTESQVNLPDALQTTDDYQWLLKRFYGFYAPLEARLAEDESNWSVLGIDYEARRKTKNIAADLAFLGMNTEEIQRLPHCEAFPSPVSIAGTIGTAYVLEGATLGGQLIARHLERTLGLNADAGARFFQSYGAATGAMWQHFRRAVDDYAARIPDNEKQRLQQEAITAARDTFRSLGAWLAHER